ncbi:MAG: glycosyltransferase family 39 protein [Candidatus Aminicenantes bacterium]|nr:glycosyltransferase family 39 protein [Candidatus Aminicenantes bacterium]
MKKFGIFVPLLFIYILFILLVASDSLIHDEPRYLQFADNITHGFYSAKDNIDLTNPPLYPLVLSPFVALGSPLIIPRLLNALFLFLALCVFYMTLLFNMKKKAAVILTYILGLFPLHFLWLHLLLTESLAILLLCLFMYSLSSLMMDTPGKSKHLFWAGLFLAMLAMTKVIFGYVIMAGLLITFFLFLVRRSHKIRKLLLVLFLAFLFCLPYLTYTGILTGNIFYWGTNGGETLYWMSSPYPDEYGDWIKFEKVLEKEWIPQVYERHGDFFKKLEPLSRFERDKLFREKAYENIRSNPTKYIQNWVSNMGRLLFNYPNSYSPQTVAKYYVLFPNMILIILSLFCLYPSIKKRESIPFEIHTLYILALVYLGGSSLVSSLVRYLLIVVPIFVLWIGYIFTQVIQIEFKE